MRRSLDKMEELADMVSGRAISETVGSYSKSLYDITLGNIPQEYALLIFIFVNAIIIISYIVFIFYSANFLSRKNILGLNLAKYDKGAHPIFNRIRANFLYILEYIIILPAFIIVWFYLLAAFLTAFIGSMPLSSIILIAATLTVVIRIMAYLNEGISNDFSKVMLTVFVAFSVISPQFSDIKMTVERIAQIPSIFNLIIYDLIFVLILEFLARIIYLIVMFIKGEDLYVGVYVDSPDNVFKSS